MQFSDLHIHSRYSDGMLWPEQIVDIASKKGLRYISITDHDTVDSQRLNEVLSKKHNISIIPGLELSTEYMEREIHILAYFVDIYDMRLNEFLNKARESRMNRARDIIDKLNSINIDIAYEEVAEEGITIGRPHIAKALVSKGYASNVKEAFQLYLVKDKPAYVGRYKIDFRHALRLINDCSGIAVLAHPGEIYKGISLEYLIKEFKVYGLKGVEVFHPSHSLKQTNDYYNLAKKYSLLITGGSDCHGSVIETESILGTYGLDQNLTNKFIRTKQFK